jgi:pimeloyl-ACP methyl ester carboxylesterase
MPTATTDGVDLYYAVDSADASDEPVVFVNDAGYGAWLWGWQAPVVARRRQTVVWDLRGTGRSDAPDGPYDVETLAADLEAVLADAGVASAHLVGAGLGGMIALAYARRYSRAETLALLGTAASGDAVDADALATAFAPRDDPAGLRASLDVALSVDHGKYPELVEDIVDWRRTDDADRVGFDAQSAAMAAFDATDWLYEVTLPTLVFHGVADRIVPADAGRRLANGLPRGEFEAVEGGHLCFVEQSRAVTDVLLDFFDERAAN